METESLSRSVEAQKQKVSEVEAVGQKRADVLSKELQKKVRLLDGLHLSPSPDSLGNLCRPMKRNSFDQN